MRNVADIEDLSPYDAVVLGTAVRMGQPLPPLRVAVRTGDTPSHARTAMVKQPPHILITTPESLYLILGSPRGRDMLRTVRSIIVDEIHTVVGEKRGVHLALSVERLEHLAGRPVQRIGLSATIRPLEEAARFLGGQDDTGQPRPVTVVDTGYKKALDLRVVMPVEDFRNLPGGSIWPSVIPQVLGDVLRHRTTLIFANNRRLAERTADRLNAQIQAERNAYYDRLESSQRGDLDVTAWLAWFLDCLARAVQRSTRELERVLHKALFWQRVAAVPLSERQARALNKVIDEFEQPITNRKWAALTRVSSDTALRDLKALVAAGVLEPASGAGRSAAYWLKGVPPRPGR